MTTFFKRIVNIAVAPKGLPASLGFELSNLDCTFSVKKHLKPEPNTCELKVFNLQESTRHTLATAKKLVLRLEAGYPGSVAQLFLGEIRSAHSRKEGADIVTTIETGDSEKELASARLNLSVGPKVPAHVVLMAIATSFKGIGIGNVPQVAAQLAARGVVFFGGGSSIHGNSAELLTDFCKSGDLEWSVQEGVLQILDRGKALNDTAVLVSSETGMIGSPTIDNKGVVSVDAFIQPDLRPGRKIKLDSIDLKGGFRINDVEYVGDTSGNDWTAKMSCSRY